MASITYEEINEVSKVLGAFPNRGIPTIIRIARLIL
jgi:hypothetical protein